MPSIEIWRLYEEEIGIAEVQELNALLKEFSPAAREMTLEAAKEIARNDRLFIAKDDTAKEHPFVGMATLIIYRKPTGLVGMVEDVIVTEKWRGKSAGRKLMRALIAKAKEEGLKALALTSNPKRVAARALYQSLGFEIKDTTCFVLTF